MRLYRCPVMKVAVAQFSAGKDKAANLRSIAGLERPIAQLAPIASVAPAAPAVAAPDAAASEAETSVHPKADEP